MVLGELQDGVIDGACGQGAKRDGRVSAFHRVECTPPHSLFSNTLLYRLTTLPSMGYYLTSNLNEWRCRLW
jgi:hypothetical protein